MFSGFPGNFGYSIMDNLYKPGISFIFYAIPTLILIFVSIDMTEEEGLDAVKKCIDQSAKRSIIHLTGFRVIVINAEGSKVIEGFKPEI